MVDWDAVNAVVLFGNCAFSLANVVALRRARKVRGVSIWAVAYFALAAAEGAVWAASAGQWLSSGGMVLLTAANAWWVGLALRYRKDGKRTWKR